MSPIPELTRTLSPRRRPSSSSTAGLSPTRSLSISRSNSNASNATSTNKKRSRGEEYPNDLPEDTTIIHNPQPVSLPSAQSPEKRTKPPAPLVSCGGRGVIRDRTSSPNRVMTTPMFSGQAAVAEDGEEMNGAVEEVRNGREDSPSTDDLLVQLPDYDWSSFMTKFEETLKEIGAEKEWLSKEHDMWNWMYEIWSSSRDCDDTRRLSQEMGTIIQWTKLKEADLERAREAHTQSMLAISSVLGIMPKNATPPPSVSKNKKR